MCSTPLQIHPPHDTRDSRCRFAQPDGVAHHILGHGYTSLAPVQHVRCDSLSSIVVDSFHLCNHPMNPSTAASLKATWVKQTMGHLAHAATAMTCNGNRTYLANFCHQVTRGAPTGLDVLWHHTRIHTLVVEDVSLSTGTQSAPSRPLDRYKFETDRMHGMLDGEVMRQALGSEAKSTRVHEATPDAEHPPAMNT